MLALLAGGGLFAHILSKESSSAYSSLMLRPGPEWEVVHPVDTSHAIDWQMQLTRAQQDKELKLLLVHRKAAVATAVFVKPLNAPDTASASELVTILADQDDTYDCTSPQSPLDNSYAWSRCRIKNRPQIAYGVAIPRRKDRYFVLVTESRDELLPAADATTELLKAISFTY